MGAMAVVSYRLSYDHDRERAELWRYVKPRFWFMRFRRELIASSAFCADEEIAKVWAARQIKLHSGSTRVTHTEFNDDGTIPIEPW